LISAWWPTDGNVERFAGRRQEGPREMLLRFTQYLRETGMEMKRVSWPSISELKESTIVVLVTVSIITVFLFVVDKILDLGIKQIIALA
jgi:preprotein translocase subunit SecE